MMHDTTELEAFKRSRGKRNKWTAIALAVFALTVYAAFFWKMDQREAASTASKGPSASIVERQQS